MFLKIPLFKSFHELCIFISEYNFKKKYVSPKTLVRQEDFNSKDMQFEKKLILHKIL